MLWENRQSNYDKYPKIKIKEIDECIYRNNGIHSDF